MLAMIESLRMLTVFFPINNYGLENIAEHCVVINSVYNCYDHFNVS